MQAMLYGCEAWGHCLLSAAADPAESTAEPELAHRTFLKHTLGMRSNTKAWIAFRETGTYPLRHACVARMLQFVAGTLALPPNDVCHLALLDNMDQVRRHPGGATWLDTLLAELTMACPDHTILRELFDPHNGVVRVADCMSAWRMHHHDRVWGALGADPRTAESTGVTLCTYHNWFATDLPEGGDHWTPHPCLTTHRLPHTHLRSLLRLRTGCHDLAVQRLRQAATRTPRIPRAARTCTCCPAPAAGVDRPVQDELHCMLECASLGPARALYPTLYSAADAVAAPGASAMKHLLTTPRLTRAVAAFVHSHVLPMSLQISPPLPTH